MYPIIIEGQELGSIIVRKNVRAKCYSLRVVNGEIIATIPKGGTERGILAFIESKRKWLSAVLANHRKQPVLNEESRLKTYTFELHIFRTRRTNMHVSLREGILHIACPEDTDFNNERIQQILQATLKKVIRMEAVRVLPSRLAKLASQHGFHYANVTIRNTKTRWGSCSAKQRINLSASLMFLPEHLIDYVLLHELCHTREMNHSDRFWALLNKAVNGCAQQLRKELKVIPVNSGITF